MKVFISWSGIKSKTFAIALREWLPKVIQSLEPWVSAADINAGDRWNAELVKALEECRFGISIVTPDNIDAPWLLFEAGALAKSVAASEKQWLCPYVLGVEFGQLSPPLKQFQGKSANREDTLHLIETLNGRLACPLNQNNLRETFDKFWPDLEKKIEEVKKMNPQVTPAPLNPADAQKEVLAELRLISERLAKLESSQPTGFSSSMSNLRTVMKVFRKDVLEAFGSLPDFSPEAVEAQIDQLILWLGRNGISTRDELFRLVRDEAALQWVREIYQKELLRESKTPLDPLAVATWVAFLHATNCDPRSKQIVIDQLRQSPEYKSKH